MRTPVQLPPDASAPPRGRPGRGFTLVEVAMAVVMLAMVITTSLTVMQRAYLDLDTERNLGIAGSIMQCELEKERLFTWAQASNAGYVPTIDSSFTGNPTVAGRFTLSRALATVHAGQTVQITLTVSWRSYDGRNLSRSYTTYYSQGGLYEYIYHNP